MWVFLAYFSSNAISKAVKNYRVNCITVQIRISCHDVEMIFHLLDSDQTGSVESSEFLVFVSLLKQLQTAWRQDPELFAGATPLDSCLSPRRDQKRRSSLRRSGRNQSSWREGDSSYGLKLWEEVMRQVEDDATKEAVGMILRFMGNDEEHITKKLDALFTFHGDLTSDNLVQSPLPPSLSTFNLKPHPRDQCLKQAVFLTAWYL